MRNFYRALGYLYIMNSEFEIVVRDGNGSRAASKASIEGAWPISEGAQRHVVCSTRLVTLVLETGKAGFDWPYMF